MIFSYKASNSVGAMVAGELEATEKKAALRELQDKGLTVTEIFGIDANSKKSIGTATTQDLLLSLHEMATLLESGVSQWRLRCCGGAVTVDNSHKLPRGRFGLRVGDFPAANTTVKKTSDVVKGAVTAALPDTATIKQNDILK